MLFVLAVGAYYDLRRGRVPNRLIFSGMAVGILSGLCLSGEPLGMSMALGAAGGFLLRMAAAAAVLFPLFYCRMIGGGDVKMAAVIFGFLGFAKGFGAVGCGFAAGALWAVLKMILQGSLVRRLSYFTGYIRRLCLTGRVTPYYDPGRDGREAVIPLCVCLFLGDLVYLILRN